MPIIPIQSSTQRHLLIADIVDDIVLTKDGGAALVLRASALNFSLMSEKEQEAIIFAYSAFLNSLSFPMQILVHSQKKDVTKYLNFLHEEEGKQTNPQLKALIATYQTFVAQIVKKRNVLEKEFFLIIPFSPFELGLSPLGALQTLFGQKRGKLPFTKAQVINKAKTALYPKRDHLIRQSGRMGIRLEQLTTEELARLYYSFYKTAPEATFDAERYKERGQSN